MWINKHFLQDDETLVEDVCEALMNSRLAECWGRGESWARLDLSGRELSLRDDHKERLEEVCVGGLDMHYASAIAGVAGVGMDIINGVPWLLFASWRCRWCSA